MVSPLVVAAGAVALLFGLLLYAVRWFSRPDDGPVLGSHYNPARYAGGGTARKPETVGVCDECGLWTDADEGFCPVCAGVVREVPADP